MGKLVSFWSPYAGHGKATSSLCAVLGGFVLQYPALSMAVSHTQKESGFLLKKLDNNAAVWKDKGWLDALGIDVLKMYSRQNAVSAENIQRCGLPVLGKSLYFYPNDARNRGDDSIVFNLLTKQLKREFEIVFLDLESGNKENSMQYLKASDFVIIVLPQDPLYVEKFLQESGDYLSGLEYGFIFGGCFSKSQYRSNYYRKIYGNKMSNKILGEILWNADFFDAMAEGKTLDFFFRNSETVKKEENYEFIRQVKKTTERIRKKINCF